MRERRREEGGREKRGRKENGEEGGRRDTSRPAAESEPARA